MSHSPFLRLKALFLFIFCAVLILTGWEARAAQQRLTPEYIAGFAFFKYAGVQPDFRSWVTLSDAYKIASPRERVNMIHNDVPFLENAFTNYDYGDSPIKIKTIVQVDIPTPSVAAKMLQELGFVTVKIVLPEEKESYFAVPVADMWIALVPKDIDSYVNIELSKEEFEGFKKAAANNGLKTMKGQAREAFLHIEMIPFMANTTSPLVVNGYELWTLMADVVSFELWSPDDKALIWYRDLPGYRPRAESNDVYNLFKQ